MNELDYISFVVILGIVGQLIYLAYILMKNDEEGESK